jgi:small subunit ribosomal protein S18
VPPKKKLPRGKSKDPKGKPRTKKVSPLVKEGIEYVDYKDVTLLRAFLSDRAKIRARRVAGNDRQQQRDAAMAIKVAREMALLPYAQRVVTQRKGDKRGRGREGGREGGRDSRSGPPPSPSGPPPDGSDVESAEGADGIDETPVEVMAEGSES